MLNKKTEFKTYSLPQQIAEEIAERIMSGEWKSGEKLIESTLSEEYGMSRAPIREALYLLEMEGLVERIPRKGTIVKSYSKDEMEDLLEIRMMLEHLAMKKVEKIGVDSALLQRLKLIIQSFEGIQENSIEYAKINRDFHTVLVSMSKSEMIKNNYERLGTPLLTLQKMSFSSKEAISGSIEDHREIIDFLEKGEVTKARILLDSHNQKVFARIESPEN